MAKIYGAAGFPKLIKGYPTQTNLIDVQGGLLGGTAEVKFGDLVVFDSLAGHYKAFVASSTLANLAGIVVATNAKLATQYPADGMEVGYKVGEAINLLPFHKANVGGYIAVELDSAVNAASVVEGAVVAFLPATGKFTVHGEGATDIPFAHFTGIVENHGTVAAPVLIAEIAVGC